MSENEIQLKLGQLLKLERERQKINLADLAESLKIKEAHLESIERGAIDELPADLYFSLFAKSYAEAIGVDYQATIQAIEEDVGAAGPNQFERREEGEAEEADESDEQQVKYGFRKKLIWMFGGIIGVFVVFLVLMNWLFDAPETADGETGEGGGPAAALSPHGFTEAELANYNFDTPPADKPEPLTLTIQASEETWTTAYADGDTAIFRSLVPGREYAVTADHRIIISIAHPSRVTTKLNGQDVFLRDPDSRRISRVLIDQVNYEMYYEERLPTQTPSPSREAAPASQPEPRPSTPQPQTSPQTTQDETESSALDAHQGTPDTATQSGDNL